MTVAQEAKLIRRWVAQLTPGRGRKYTPALRRRIISWVERAKQSGMLEAECSNAIGVPQHRFEMWREVARRDAERADALGDIPEEQAPTEAMPDELSRALVPVQMASPIGVTAGLAFVAPHGCRIEGLTLEQAVALLREFE